MSDNPNRVIDKKDEEPEKINSAYMNRIFCTTKERISYILYTAYGTTTLGKYDVGSEIWLYDMYKLRPTSYAKATATLTIYDMINDPVTAAIIDNLRTRWGKFKPFQFLSLIPSILGGIYICMLPILANHMGWGASTRLLFYMIYLYYNETVGAFFGGGGYIKNVFTPNPNERTSLLVSAKFVSDLFAKFPAQFFAVLLDLRGNGILNLDYTKMFVTGKWIVWIISMVPTIMWYLTSKERVPQSEKPPQPIKSIGAVFRNRPLLVHILSGFIDDINLGQGGDLYYNDVLHFNTLETIAGIPGSPISYYSYAIVPKMRKKFSTKALWFFDRGSLFFKEVLFFLVGIIGGRSKGFYLKKLPMALAFAVGNSVQMLFYATGKVIGDEIGFEILDYCEWKNGYRVEATMELFKGYFTKIKDIFLRIINAHLLENWAGFDSEAEIVPGSQTGWRLFLIAFGPKLVFDAFCFIPMLFYNINEKTREQMYIELEKSRAMRAAIELNQD
ncbi:MAG: MFS transporter [Clostridiales bacterium]|nr:MFS transporter [Clostridiales bacterium]